jgi:hypothetical protein
MGVVMPLPVMETVLSMTPPTAGSAKLLTRAWYTSTASLPAGMLIPLSAQDSDGKCYVFHKFL